MTRLVGVSDAAGISETKTCSRCDFPKPIGEFSLKKKSTGERRSECKKCRVDAHAAHVAQCKSDGVCPDCRASTDGERLYCDKCRAKRAKASRAKRARRKSARRCVHCGTPSGRLSLCKGCRPIYAAHNKRLRDKNKQAVLDHYGHACACCGEARSAFLTIDHIDGGGNKHRKEIGGSAHLHSWLIKNKFPDGFRTLCFNCNCGRRFTGGVCPHELERKT